jgi:NADPH:quinone reductase-like Zn-dependent oxidoreductase
MRALRFSGFGPPSVPSIQEIQKPEPGEGDVLIQVKAAAINRVTRRMYQVISRQQLCLGLRAVISRALS